MTSAIRWPQAPSVLMPTPKAIADLAAALVRLLAQAHTGWVYF